MDNYLKVNITCVDKEKEYLVVLDPTQGIDFYIKIKHLMREIESVIKELNDIHEMSEEYLDQVGSDQEPVKIDITYTYHTNKKSFTHSSKFDLYLAEIQDLESALFNHIVNSSILKNPSCYVSLYTTYRDHLLMPMKDYQNICIKESDDTISDMSSKLLMLFKKNAYVELGTVIVEVLVNDKKYFLPMSSEITSEILKLI